MFRRAFAGLLIAVCGCAAQPQEQRIASTVTEAELAPYRRPGQALVKGQAFLRQQGGGVVTCAGETVQLSPLTMTMREQLQAVRSCKRPVVTGYVQIGPLITRTTTCDAQGNFRFENVPAGDWVLITRIGWIVAGVQQGGAVAKEIAVPNKGQVETLLTDRERVCPQ